MQSLNNKNLNHPPSIRNTLILIACLCVLALAIFFKAEQVLMEGQSSGNPLHGFVPR